MAINKEPSSTASSRRALAWLLLVVLAPMAMAAAEFRIVSFNVNLHNGVLKTKKFKVVENDVSDHALLSCALKLKQRETPKPPSLQR